jgi:DNA polymerase IV
LASVDPSSGVRLLGVNVAQLVTRTGRHHQLSFDEDATGTGDAGSSRVDWDGASHAVDEVRKRFGAASIGPASLVRTRADGRAGLAPLRRGQQQWGPDGEPSG